MATVSQTKSRHIYYNNERKKYLPLLNICIFLERERKKLRKIKRNGDNGRPSIGRRYDRERVFLIIFFTLIFENYKIDLLSKFKTPKKYLNITSKKQLWTKDHAAHEAFDKLMAKFGDFHRLMRRHPDASKVEDDGTFSFIFRPHTFR